MNALHVTDMVVLILAFLSRSWFYVAIERQTVGAVPDKVPRIILIIPVTLVAFIMPINRWIDVAMYAIAGPLLFWSALKWQDTITDFRVLRQAGVKYPNAAAYLLRERQHDNQ